MMVQALVMSQICNRVWMSNNRENMTYLFPDSVEEDPASNNEYSMRVFLSFYLAFNGLIPLDLAVTFVLVKLLYIFALTGDKEMMDLKEIKSYGQEEDKNQGGDNKEEEDSLVNSVVKGCQVKNLEIL